MRHHSFSQDVYLNVYDLQPQAVLCCGVFHTGVVIDSDEWLFASGGGIQSHEPREAPYIFRESIWMGRVHLSETELNRKLDALRPKYSGDKYSVVLRNCNHFSDDLLSSLNLEPVPPYINRLAWFGSFFSFLLPPLDAVPLPTSASPRQLGPEATQKLLTDDEKVERRRLAMRAALARSS